MNNPTQPEVQIKVLTAKRETVLAWCYELECLLMGLAAWLLYNVPAQDREKFFNSVRGATARFGVSLGNMLTFDLDENVKYLQRQIEEAPKARREMLRKLVNERAMVEGQLEHLKVTMHMTST